MRISRCFTLLIALVLAAASASAQAGSFLNIPGDVRELAMGGLNAGSDAVIVLDDDKVDVDVSYLMWSPKGVASNIITADLGYRIGKLGIIAEAGVNVYDPYYIYDEWGNSTGEYSPNEIVAGIGAAYKVIPGLGVSVMAKYVGASLAEGVNKSAVCADVNAVFRLKSLTVGLSGSNIGSGTLPMLVEAGARHSFSFGKVLKLGVGLDAGYMAQGQNGAVVASAGVDFRILDMISVMAGYHFSTDTSFEPSYVSAGLGVDVAMIRISAAYLTGNPYIGNTLGITLGCAF